MFAYIEGKFVMSAPPVAVIDVNGVGFSISTSMYTLGNLKTGEKVRLHTYLSVREDALELFGFLTEEELRCFKMLISISGVGPKAALSILSSTTPANLALAIATEDTKVLTNAQGVGKKLASRIILELKDKMLKSGTEISSGDLQMPAMPAAGGAEAEAVEALMVLGYSQAEAMQAMEGLKTDSSLTAEELIRACLKKLAAQ